MDKLIYNKKFIIGLFFIFIFLLNLSLYFSKFLDLTYEEVYKDEFQILNIYKKDRHNILKLKADDYIFFTSSSKNRAFEKLDYVSVLFISKDISFINYLRGFYSKSIDIQKLQKSSLKQKIFKKLENIHKNKDLSNLFGALFLGTSVNKKLREVFTNYSISHLIALSGFHIALITTILYFIIYYPYNFIHQKYFPYRHKKADIGLFILVILFFYLIFIGFIPSLLRAFIMSIIGLLILRSNLKLVSFETLIFTFLLIISLFPQYLFSIGFWFSISAVFYIFLYIHYFKYINKFLHLIFFNFWMFIIFNPIVHYFFSQTSYQQFLSIPITLVFSIFYPTEIFLHLIKQGALLDTYLISFFSSSQEVWQKATPNWFFFLYLIISFLSIHKKVFFYILNILAMLFSIFLYVV